MVIAGVGMNFQTQLSVLQLTRESNAVALAV